MFEGRRCVHVAATGRSATAYAVDLAAVSFRRATGTAVPHGDRWLEGVVSFRRGRAQIDEALCGDRATNSFRDEFGDVDDPLALVDACFHVITHPHR